MHLSRTALMILLALNVLAEGWTTRSFGRTAQTVPLTRQNFFNFGGKEPAPPSDGDELMSISADKPLGNLTPRSQYEALCDYLFSWGKLFEKDGNGLTTSVNVVQPKAEKVADAGYTVPVRMEFVVSKTGSAYKSSTEEKEAEGGNDSPKSEKKAALPGGVEVRVFQGDDNSLLVSANRCNMDDDTTVKEMSEETIVTELQDAVRVWRNS